MTGSIGTVSKLAVLSITVLVLVSSTGFSGAYFSDQASSDGTQISVADPEPTRGDLKFTPKSLSTTNQGTTTIHLEQPAGSTIDPESAVATVDGRSVDAPVRTCNPQKCLFEPTAQAVVDASGAGEPTLEVTATLENGSELEASTTVRIFEPGGGAPGHGHSRDQGDSKERDLDPNGETTEPDTENPDASEETDTRGNGSAGVDDGPATEDGRTAGDNGSAEMDESSADAANGSADSGNETVNRDESDDGTRANESEEKVRDTRSGRTPASNTSVPEEGESGSDSIERSSNGSNESVSERPSVENGSGDSTASANESEWSGADPENDTADGESGTESTPNATSTDERTADRIETEGPKSGESATNSSDRAETASDEESLGTSGTNDAGTDSDSEVDDAEADDTEIDSDAEVGDADDARLDAETTATSEAESDDRIVAT